MKSNKLTTNSLVKAIKLIKKEKLKHPDKKLSIKPKFIKTLAVE